MIDPKLQAEFRERFNPEGSEMRIMQLRMLEMLKYIDRICRENNIKYWLSSGTCLGAVRHGGFIPWDDDVDIEMLKQDYKKLKKVVINDPECLFDWQDYQSDESYNYAYAKLRDKKSEIEENVTSKYKFNGLFIDIFVITPSNSLLLRRLSASIYGRTNLFIAKMRSMSLRKYCRCFLNNAIIPVLDGFQHIFANGRLRHISGVYIFNSRRYEDVKDVKYIRFEDTELPVPINVESYLTGLYGDYNRLPDPDTHPHNSISLNAEYSIEHKHIRNVGNSNKGHRLLIFFKESIINLICILYKLTIPAKVKKLRGKQISVLYIVNDISKWKSEELYIRMLEDDRFDPVVGLTFRTNQSQSVMERMKSEAEKYLKQCNYSYIELSDTLSPVPDIIIYSEPYWKAVPKNQIVLKYLSSLFISINYGFHAVQLGISYHSMVHEFAWIDCYESRLAINSAYKNIGKRRKSIRLTGLPMTDTLLKAPGKDPWKPQRHRKKRIIWAPHHSLGGFQNESIIYSNFLSMCEYMFQLAEEFHDDIQIAFKPHPLLREKLEVLWGPEKTKEYYDRWDRMENGQLSSGVYVDLFKYSDAMIHDCSSFMIEYQYMNKPMLFIAKDCELVLRDLNDFAKKAFFMQDIANSFDGIKRFILNVIDDIDIKKEERNRFYKEELLPPNNRTACDNILEEIVNGRP